MASDAWTGRIMAGSAFDSAPDSVIIDVNEDVEGYAALLDEARGRFPMLPADWGTRIVSPAFAANERVLSADEADRTMTVNKASHRLARALAERISEVLPAQLTARASGDDVALFADGVQVGGSASVSIVDEVDDWPLADRVCTAAGSVLSTIQDDVMEYLALEWPKGPDGVVALPESRVEGVGAPFARRRGRHPGGHAEAHRTAGAGVGWDWTPSSC